MFHPLPAIERLNAEWAWMSRSREASAALARWADDPVLAGAATLDEVLARGARADRASTDRVLRALAARCRHDPIALRTLLQALLPGIVRLACRIERGPVDVGGDLVGLAWMRLATVAYDQRPGDVAANVLVDLRKYYIREQRHRADIGYDDLGAENRGEPARRRRPTVPDNNRLPLTRQGAVWVEANGSQPSQEDAVDDRDELVRLFRRSRVKALTTQVLWARACGVDNSTIRSQLGLTRTQPWDHWRRGVAALANCAQGGCDGRAA